MTRRTIKPWKPPEPGFRFFTEEMSMWLGGYRPTLAHSHVSTAAASAAARKGSGEPGFKRFGTIGGTIEGMGPTKRERGRSRTIANNAPDSSPELQQALKRA